MNYLRIFFLCLFVPFCGYPAFAQEKPIAENWDYAKAMKAVAVKFKGRPGVVIHAGDSITFANPYGQWARYGEGRTDSDKAILRWMHAGKDDDSDGWWLARTDQADGSRSYTAASGMRIDEMLIGGRREIPSFEKMLEMYKPQAVVFMLGTNDITARRETADFRKNYISAIDMMLERGIVPIVSTIPPHVNNPRASKLFNEEIRDIAKDKSVPLIDFEKEILKRRPDDWNGTLMNKNDVHPSAEFGGTKASSAPTAENLKNSGYLLRGWLTVQKIAEVKAKVIDGLEFKKEEPKPKPATPQAAPKGKPIRLPITRDTWLSNVGDEANRTNGGATKLKLKSYQEMSLFDVDIESIKGKIIAGATLHVKVAGEERLHRIAVGTIGAEWVEGKGSGYAIENGASTFKHRKHPDVPWTIPGSDLCAVMFGEGGTVWSHDDASTPDADGWQVIPIHPGVIHARVAGAGYGFVMFDDTGSEWTREGEKFTWRHFPNRFVHSRESGEKSAPYLTVYVGDADDSPPGEVTKIESDASRLPAGEAMVRWTTPNDTGAGVWAFQVKIDDIEVPRYLIPIPKRPGEQVTMHVRDLKLKPGSEASIVIRAVDGAGNIGNAAAGNIRVSGFEAKALPGKSPLLIEAKHELPKIGGATVAIVDELDKVDPVSGEMIPKQADGYMPANHLWSAKDRAIRLFAAKGEIIAFQIALTGNVQKLAPSLAIDKVAVNFGRYVHVPAGKQSLPDPIVPLVGVFSVPAEDEAIEGQKIGSLHVELVVPTDIRAGDHSATLTLQSGDEKLDLPVKLHVWDFTLPTHLSFLPEMNAYSVGNQERSLYRLAHRHRTIFNSVPYSQRGEVVPGWGPGWNGLHLDFVNWDRRFGPYFDGSAFEDLPRKGVALECFYLPLHENFPSQINRHYNGSYWADEAFDENYRKAFVAASKQFAEHISDRGWHDTLFQCYFNNKVDYKRNGWSRTTSPWLLDEPQSFQDFWALRYFAQAFHEGVSSVQGNGKLVFRADISRPMWQRDSLNGLLDYNVVNIDWRRYRRMVLDRQRAHGDLIIEYGSANDIARSNMQAVGWCIDAWSLGADGVVPWLTLGSGEAWRKAESTSLFYPPKLGQREPTPSIRLKAYLRGQQDVEYMTLLSQVMKEPRWSIGEQVRERLKLVGKREATGAAGEDAGVLTYDKLLPQDAWALRMQIGEALSKAKPAAKERLVEFRGQRRLTQK